MSEKPVIFISHSSQDKELAEVLKTQVENLLASVQPNVFVSSTPDAIDIGDRWFETIIQKLKSADALLALITPTSIESKWVWFEIGYFWSKKDQGKGHIYPLYLPQVTIPHPLSELQAKALNNEQEILVVVRRLCNQFQVAESNKGSVDLNIITSMANAKPIKILPPNQLPPSILMQYTNYTDDELREVLDDFLRSCAREYYKAIGDAKMVGEEWWIEDRDFVFNGDLIEYESLDNNLGLPLGTSKRFLKEVATRYNLVPQANSDHENTVRFELMEKSSQPSVEKHVEAYSDDALTEILSEYVEQQRFRYAHSLPLRETMGNFEPNLFAGALIDYQLLDQGLKLPLGTSKRLLKHATSKQGLVPVVETEHNIRFEYKSELDQTVDQDNEHHKT